MKNVFKMNDAKTWNIKISVPQIILFRGSIEYFCYISRHKSVFLLYTRKWRYSVIVVGTDLVDLLFLKAYSRSPI